MATASDEVDLALFWARAGSQFLSYLAQIGARAFAMRFSSVRYYEPYCFCTRGNTGHFRALGVIRLSDDRDCRL